MNDMSRIILSDYQRVESLTQYLTGTAIGRSFPLLLSHSESKAIVEVLRFWCNQNVPQVERQVNSSICVVAFGSMGRGEFVWQLSDLDPMIIVKDPKSPTINGILRQKILGRLSRRHEWLSFDDKRLILNSRWNEIKHVNLKYPIVSSKILKEGKGKRIYQRRWQFLLEACCLYNREFFDQLTDDLMPVTMREHKGSNKFVTISEIDFEKLSESIRDFYASFENPSLLYKSAFKYWKSRFMREFYLFANSIAFILGWHLQKTGASLQAAYLREPTEFKMLNSLQFARQIETQTSSNPLLNNKCLSEFRQILARNNIDSKALENLENDHSCGSESARMLYGILFRIIESFSECWEYIYSSEIRSVLGKIHKDNCNFDARFRAKVENAEAALLVDKLIEQRGRYWNYLSAAAEMIDWAFCHVGIWIKSDKRDWISNSLKPFYLSPTTKR